MYFLTLKSDHVPGEERRRDRRVAAVDQGVSPFYVDILYDESTAAWRRILNFPAHGGSLQFFALRVILVDQ
jgi:hypothetical protein